MTDVNVFFCTTNRRPKIEVQCYNAWLHQPVKMVFTLRPSSLSVSPYEFQKERRVYADQHSDGVYIIADDDCFPSSNIITRGLEVLYRYPEFAILSAFPDNETIYPWTPEDYMTVLNDEVMEHVSVGGIRFCRQIGHPLLKWEWPAQTKASYDTEHCEAIRKVGMRVGYMRQVTMTHLGKGKTTIEN